MLINAYGYFFQSLSEFRGYLINLDGDFERAINAATKFFVWLADPTLSLGRAILFGINFKIHKLFNYLISKSIDVDGQWDALSVVAGVFRNIALLVDYIERGLDVMQAFAASTIINHLTQLKKLFVWRELKSRWENSFLHLRSEKYDVDIMGTVATLKVSAANLVSFLCV